MTIAIGGIIQLLVLLLPVVLTAIAARNTPKAQLDKLNEESDKAVVDGNVVVINRLIHDVVPEPSNSNLLGPAGKV